MSPLKLYLVMRNINLGKGIAYYTLVRFGRAPPWSRKRKPQTFLTPQHR